VGVAAGAVAASRTAFLTDGWAGVAAVAGPCVVALFLLVIKSKARVMSTNTPPAPAPTPPPAVSVFNLLTYLSAPRQRASEFLQGLAESAQATADGRKTTAQAIAAGWFPKNGNLVQALTSCAQSATSDACVKATTSLSSSDVSAALAFAAKNSDSFLPQMCASLDTSAMSAMSAQTEALLLQAGSDFGWYAERLLPSLVAQKSCDTSSLNDQAAAVKTIARSFSADSKEGVGAFCSDLAEMPVWQVVLIALAVFATGVVLSAAVTWWLAHRNTGSHSDSDSSVSDGDSGAFAPSAQTMSNTTSNVSTETARSPVYNNVFAATSSNVEASNEFTKRFSELL
jgi:hypothetical protein